MTRVVWLAAVAAAVAVPPTGRAAIGDVPPPPVAGAVTGVRITPMSGRTEVAIAFSGDVEVTDFALGAPHRIVIDFEPASLKMMPRLYDGVVRGGITSIRVAQFKPNVVRVVMDVDNDREYTVVRGGSDVRLRLDSPNAEFEPWAMGSAAAPPVATPDAPTPVATRVVSDVVPPVAELTIIRPPVGATKAFDRTSDAVRFVPQQTSQRVTISFQNTPLRDVLSQFAVFSGQSIVPGAIGNQTVSAEIIDQPWQVALNSILQSQGLVAIIEPSGIIRIDSQANIAANALTERLVKRMLALNYARAADLQPIVKELLSRDCAGANIQVVGAAGGGGDAGGGDASAGATPPIQQQLQQGVAVPQGGCQPRGSVTAEPQTNQLIITEVESQMDTLLAYAASFDVRTQQVNISSKIISIDRTTTNQLGISYDLGSNRAFFNTLSPRLVNGAPQTGESFIQLGGDALAGVANAGKQFSGSSALSLIYSTTIGNFSLTSFIDALASENLTDIQVQPSVNVLDKKPAEIFVGDKVAFLITPPTAPGAIQNAAPQISSSEIGSRLKVTPSISANRMIRLDVAIEQSALTSLTEAGPTSSTRLALTTVLVQDGETAVIGGLTQATTTKLRRGIPLLMQLPLIGRLFAENESIERNSDLLVLITPRILDDPIPPPAGDRN